MGKRARWRRREAGQTRLNQKARRKLVTEAEARVDALMTRLLDPEVAAADVAPHLLDFWHGAAVDGDVAFLVCRQTSAARGRAIADAALDIDPEDLVALSFAAAVAEFEGDDRRAVELWKAATRVSNDDEVKWSYAAALVGAGSTGAAFDMIEHACREDPADDLWQALFRDALQVAHGRSCTDTDRQGSVSVQLGTSLREVLQGERPRRARSLLRPKDVRSAARQDRQLFVAPRPRRSRG